jgi:hypothetical protein
MSEQQTNPHVPIYYLSGNHDIGYSGFHSVHPKVIDYDFFFIISPDFLLYIYMFFKSQFIAPITKHCCTTCRGWLRILCLVVYGFGSLM